MIALRRFPVHLRGALAGVALALLVCAPSARASSDIRLSASVVSSNDSVSVIFGSGDPPFLVLLSSYTIERSGSNIGVTAIVQLAPQGVAAPDFEIPLGRLPPGNYTIYAEVQLPIAVNPMPVVLGLQVVPATVPANHPWWLFALLPVIFATAVRRLRMPFR